MISIAMIWMRIQMELKKEVKGSSLAILVQNEGQDYTSSIKMSLYLNALILSNNSGMGLFKVKDGKITSYNATKIFDRNKFTYKYSFYKL